MQILTVYHRGMHTRFFKPSVAQNGELITEVVWDNADLGQQGLSEENLQKHYNNTTMGDVAQLAIRLSDKPRIKHVKQGMVSFQHPETQSFVAVGGMKTTATIYDRYLIYSLNFQKLINKPSWVFSLSEKWGSWT